MMERIKVLLAECDFSDRPSTLCNVLSEREDVEMLPAAHSGFDVLELVKTHEPDLVLLDLMLPGIDGLYVMRALRRLRLPKPPAILLCTALPTASVLEEAIRLGAIHCLLKPADSRWLAQRALEIYRMHEAYILHLEGRTFELSEVYGILTNILRELWVPPNLRGYSYLKSGAMLTLRRPDTFYGITTSLYPLVAEEYKTSASQVERSIRHAIEVTWVRGNLEGIHRLFGNSVQSESGRPTNTEFIARVADETKLRLMRLSPLPPMREGIGGN